MGNGATDTVLRSAGQTGVTRLDSLPLMGPVPSSPGHLTAHLINPPPRPAQASFPIHTLWLLELSKTLMRAGLSRHQTLLRRHIVLGMKSKLLDHLAPGPSPGMPRPLTARSPGVGAPTTCPSLSQHGRPARCHAHPLHTPSSAVQVGFHTPRSWPGTAALRGPLTVPAMVERGGLAAGPGAGQGGHCRGRGRSAAPAAQTPQHSTPSSLWTSPHFCWSAQAFPSCRATPSPPPSALIPVAAPSAGPVCRELIAGAVSTSGPHTHPASQEGSGPHPHPGRMVSTSVTSSPQPSLEHLGSHAGAREEGSGQGGLWRHHVSSPLHPRFERARPKVRGWGRGSSLGLPGRG